MGEKTDTVTIRITGNKKFRQSVVDLIYETLFQEDVAPIGKKPGCKYLVQTTMEPSEEVKERLGEL